MTQLLINPKLYCAKLTVTYFTLFQVAPLIYFLPMDSTSMYCLVQLLNWENFGMKLYITSKGYDKRLQ